MRSSQAVTDADGLVLGFAFIIAVYAALGVMVFWLLRRLARRSPETEVG